MALSFKNNQNKRTKTMRDYNAKAAKESDRAVRMAAINKIGRVGMKSYRPAVEVKEVEPKKVVGTFNRKDFEVSFEMQVEVRYFAVSSFDAKFTREDARRSIK